MTLKVDLAVGRLLFEFGSYNTSAASDQAYTTVALKVALRAMRSATISYASCAMCYALCDDFLCVMRDATISCASCAMRRFPVRRGACCVGPLKDLF